MRKILLPLISLTIFLSCDKDNDSENTNNNSPTNYVLYDNNYYDIGGDLFITDYGQSGANFYNLDIDIFPPNNSESDYNLYFEMFSPDTMLESGIYNFSDDIGSMTFDIGEFVVFDEDDEVLNVQFTNGTIDLNINTENLTITIDVEGTTNTNKDITAHWEGSYIYQDIWDLIDSEENLKKNKRINL